MVNIDEIALGADPVGGERDAKKSRRGGRRLLPGCAGRTDEEDETAIEQIERGDAVPASLKPQMGDARPRLSGERLRLLEKFGSG